MRILKRKLKKHAIRHFKTLAQVSSQTDSIHFIIIAFFTFLKRAFAYAERQFRLAGKLVDHEQMTEKMRTRYFHHLDAVTRSMGIRPKFSILLPVYKVERKFLELCLESIETQVYANWEVCIVDDFSNDSQLVEAIRAFAMKYPGKVKWKAHDKNQHISATSNSCLALATGDYVCLLDHDDELTPNALAEMVRHINLHSGPEILYSDEIVIGPQGSANGGAFYKPNWSPIMMRSYNMVTHFLVIRRQLVQDIGGFRIGVEGAQDHDLILRAAEAARNSPVHVPFVLYRWRSHPASSASSIDAKPYAAIAGEKVIRDHLGRLGVPFESVAYDPSTGHHRVEYKSPVPAPLVSIIIPTRDGIETLDRCLNSLFGHTRYTSFEVIVVDNGSIKPEFLKLLADWTHKQDRLSVIRVDEPFNFARLNRFGADAARGEFLLLLNDDTEVRDPRWLDKMVALAVQNGVGVVGPKLLYPNGQIQHAGIVGLPGPVAGHVGAKEAAHANLYNHVLNTTREVAAVTGACLLIRRELFNQVGRLDEVHIPNAFGDVDLCFKVRKAGLSCVYCCEATLVHYESMTRGVNFENYERNYMHAKWPGEILNDPYLNPNLGRDLYFEVDSRFPELT